MQITAEIPLSVRTYASLSVKCNETVTPGVQIENEKEKQDIFYSEHNNWEKLCNRSF